MNEVVLVIFFVFIIVILHNKWVKILEDKNKIEEEKYCYYCGIQFCPLYHLVKVPDLEQEEVNSDDLIYTCEKCKKVYEEQQGAWMENKHPILSDRE